MPLKVLRKHTIVERNGDLISRNVKELTFEQKAQIKMICDKKLQELWMTLVRLSLLRTIILYHKGTC